MLHLLACIGEADQFSLDTVIVTAYNQLICLICPACSRGQLKALVDIHGASEGLGGNLSEDEIKVICGALDLTNKTARK